MSSPSAKPHKKGTATPLSEIASAVLPTCRTNLRSVSMPVRSSKRRTPSWAIPSSMAFCSGDFGKSACCRSGHSSPRADGPSSMPPSSIPITEGWPKRIMSSPRRRPTNMSRTSCARKVTAEGPLVAAAAPHAQGVLSPNAAPITPMEVRAPRTSPGARRPTLSGWPNRFINAPAGG